MSVVMDPAPEDSPNTVTALGSPPKASMLVSNPFECRNLVSQTTVRLEKRYPRWKMQTGPGTRVRRRDS